MTTPMPGGPPLPDSTATSAADRMYPKADGQPVLREAIAAYHRDCYGAKIDADNVAVFAGRRPASFAILAFLQDDVRVAIEETGYTPYYDVLEVLGRRYSLIASNPHNRFRSELADHPREDRVLLIESNPCNPSGVATTGDELRAIVKAYSTKGRGASIDEAYEFFLDPEPESALRYIDDIDSTNLFVVGEATKGLQVPGMRVGWVVASREHIELFRNDSSFAMGGVSRDHEVLLVAARALRRRAREPRSRTVHG